MLLSTQLTLLLQLLTDPSPPSRSGCSSRSSNREQASLPSAPISLSHLSPHPLGIQLCWLCGGPSSPLSVCTYWSLCPRAREQCPRTQKEGERQDLLFSRVPPGKPVLSVFPPPSVHCCCCSVIKLCPTLWDLMNCSTLDSSVLCYIPEFAQIHVHWVADANRLILCCPLFLLPSIFPSFRVFSNDSALCIRWPKYCCFSISPSNWMFRVDFL